MSTEPRHVECALLTLSLHALCCLATVSPAGVQNCIYLELVYPITFHVVAVVPLQQWQAASPFVVFRPIRLHVMQGEMQYIQQNYFLLLSRCRKQSNLAVAVVKRACDDVGRSGAVPNL